jgi:hypothetical protein
MILYTMLPLWVIIYKRSKLAFYIGATLLCVAGVIIIGVICYIHNLRVGILTFEDYYLYSYQFNKPYTKLVAISTGMLTAAFYFRAMDYKSASLESKKKNYSWLHFIRHSKIASLVLFTYGMGMLMFVTAATLTANQNGYLWTKWENTIYYAFGRLGYCSSVIAILVLVVMDKANAILSFLGQPLWRPFAKITFAAYLIYPLAITLNFQLSNDAVFLSYATIVYFMVANIVTSYLFGFILHIFFEAPITNVIKLTSRKLSSLFEKRSNRNRNGKSIIILPFAHMLIFI